MKLASWPTFQTTGVGRISSRQITLFNLEKAIQSNFAKESSKQKQACSNGKPRNQFVRIESRSVSVNARRSTVHCPYSYTIHNFENSSYSHNQAFATPGLPSKRNINLLFLMWTSQLVSAGAWGGCRPGLRAITVHLMQSCHHMPPLTSLVLRPKFFFSESGNWPTAS